MGGGGGGLLTSPHNRYMFFQMPNINILKRQCPPSIQLGGGGGAGMVSVRARGRRVSGGGGGVRSGQPRHLTRWRPPLRTPANYKSC